MKESYADLLATLTPAYIEKLKTRFMAKVVITLHPDSVLDTDCWLWTGAIHYKGYGEVRVAHRKCKTHRLAMLLFGPHTDDPTDQLTDHVCRVRACCNPDHLKFVTNRQNIMAEGSLALAKKLADATHCINGHEFTAENTYSYRGYRYCRACHKVRTREHWRKNYGANLKYRA